MGVKPVILILNDELATNKWSPILNPSRLNLSDTTPALFRHFTTTCYFLTFLNMNDLESRATN